MSDSQRDIEVATEDVSMVTAMEALVNTIKKIHAVFIGLAIGVPILLVLFMAICVGLVTHVIWGVEERLSKRLEAIPAMMGDL